MHSVVVERAEHVLFERFLQANLVCHVVAEQFEDVRSIGAFRRCRHAEHEIRFEMVDDAFVRIGCRVVHLVYENVVEIVCSELREHFRTRHRLHSGEYVFAVRFLAGAGEQAEFTVRAAEHFLERFLGFAENLLLLRDVQHAIWFDLANIECGQVRLAGAGRGNDDSAAFALSA